jgi:hypothetical protein
MAYELGTFRVTVNDEVGTPVFQLAKHLAAWKKRDIGTW